ncbi:MAG: methyltransferase domain-containing protein, partial [Patescibacteria group bacterium]
EIIVRDDSTNLETENLIENYLKKTSVSIRYFKGKKEGLDTAIIFLTQEAKGDYVWWFGDDILVEGAISYVIELVKKSPQIFFIWVNSCNINHKNDTAFKLEGNKFFDNRNQLLEKDIGLLGFISVTIFKREKALSGIEKSKKYIGSAFVNLYLILHVLSQDGKFYFLNTPYVISEPKLAGEQRWYDPFQVFGINLYKIVYEFEDKFNKQSIKKALIDNFRRVWRAVVVERAMGFTAGFGSKTPKIKQMFKCYWSYWEFYIALPLFLTPRFILRILYKIYKFFKQQPHRLLFRKFFPHKTKIDFPAGYIPNRFFLSRIDKGPILVVGDYAGRDYPSIKEKIKETYLLDIVDNNIADNKFFIKQSITELIKFPDNYFQYIVIAEVIEHIWEEKATLKELHRILLPEGKLLMSVPLFHDFADHHYHIYSPKTILILLKHSGFSITEAQYKGLAVAIPNGIIALMALLLFPIFGEKALPMVNHFFYCLHLLSSGQKKINSIFRFKYPFLRGYGVLIEAVKSNEIIDSVQIQKDSFQL